MALRSLAAESFRTDVTMAFSSVRVLYTSWVPAEAGRTNSSTTEGNTSFLFMACRNIGEAEPPSLTMVIGACCHLPRPVLWQRRAAKGPELISRHTPEVGSAWLQMKSCLDTGERAAYKLAHSYELGSLSFRSKRMRNLRVGHAASETQHHQGPRSRCRIRRTRAEQVPGCPKDARHS